MRIAGLGAWASGMPSWAAMRAVARGEAEPQADAPRRPSTDLLPANERRRAPDTVLLALQVAQAACIDADADPKVLPSVFASMHGDLTITDFMCQTLAQSPTDISPTKFHNSVHNAAAGYWTIGVGCHAAATAISAYEATFAQGLLEAAMQLAEGAPAVLLVASDGPSAGPLAAVSRSTGLLGVALVLMRDEPVEPGLRLHAELRACTAFPHRNARLFAQLKDNAMSPALVLLEALALGEPECELDAGPQLSLALRFTGQPRP
ncbi:MAG: beta-ketoacyl synthase chain length factor [Pseudomarimonas sp.]